jgi:putative Holliday junction resolvase
VSICDEKQLIATPFKTINRATAKDLIDELKRIIEENNIKGIIIGNPLNMDGSSGSSAQSVKDTSNNIEKSIDLPICLWDERLSTVGAFNLSSQLDINVSKREKKIDENAAAFILQGAIDFLNN